VLRAFVAAVLAPTQRVGEAWLLAAGNRRFFTGPKNSSLPRDSLRLWVDIRMKNGVIIVDDPNKGNDTEYCIVVRWHDGEPVEVDFDLATELQAD
jgi:hypothetical protein